MILTSETILHGIAGVLRDRIGPALDDRFAGEAARLAALLLAMNADWADDAAAVRVAENAAIRVLFADADVRDEPLAARLSEAAASADPGLRISELDAESNRLRALLVDLYAHVDEARSMAFGQRIWRLLDTLEAARAPRR